MREIKFRAWTGKEYDYDICINNSGKVIDFDCGEYVGELDYVVEQYIYMKDKNGKEIYEGDVVYIVYSAGVTEILIANMFNLRANLRRFGGTHEIVGNVHEGETNERN